MSNTKRNVGMTAEHAHAELARFMQDQTALPDPHPLLAWLRENERVADVGEMRFLTRHEDVAGGYCDERLSRNRAALAESAAHSADRNADELLKEARLASVSMLINQDEPAHRRIRKILEATFSPRRVATWKQRIEGITDELMTTVSGKVEFDFLSELAFPLPERVICELMGVPHEDHGLWRAWSEAVVSAARTHSPTPEKMAAVDHAHRSFYLYFKDLVAERRKNLGDDLVSILIRAESENDRLSEVELLGSLQMLIEAGHETTANLIANGMYELLKHPDQYQLLRDEPGRVAAAVEEMLRYASPSQFSLPRIAVEDVPIGERVIPKGCPVIMSLHAANRDPAMFERPEEFDIRRPANHRHIAFATGPHFCLGNQFARQEAHAMFRAIVTRLPLLKLAREPRLKQSFVRAFDSLRVRVA